MRFGVVRSTPSFRANNDGAKILPEGDVTAAAELRGNEERGARPLRSVGVSVSGGAPLFLSAHFPKRPTCRTERLFIIVTYDLSTISIRTTEDCGYSDSRGDWEKCHCCTSSLYPMIFSISGFFGNQQNCQCS